MVCGATVPINTMKTTIETHCIARNQKNRFVTQQCKNDHRISVAQAIFVVLHANILLTEKWWTIHVEWQIFFVFPCISQTMMSLFVVLRLPHSIWQFDTVEFGRICLRSKVVYYQRHGGTWAYRQHRSSLDRDPYDCFGICAYDGRTLMKSSIKYRWSGKNNCPLCQLQQLIL